MKKKYNHINIEKGKNQKWIDKKFFSTHDENKDSYSIILPPPNITGKLHLGHAWDGFIQDSIIRYKKLKGKDVMWIPGMDHAGIATQAKVEERLRKEGISKHDLGREDFLEKILEWKEEYAIKIRKQWGSLGLALDYDKERFTMDKGLLEAVQKVFIKMYNDKLIYKGKKAINWDPKLQTVLSNIEVEFKDISQKMYYIKYDLKDGGFIDIATTRTETLYSDVAIAVNPKDLKMKHLIGKIAIHPLNGKELPIIGDEYVEMNKGTGAMKVSAHSEVDFDILIKNNLPIIETIDKLGKMNKKAKDFFSKDRFDARILIYEKLKKKNKILKIEQIISSVGYSERSGEPIEILVQPQWFVKMKPLSKKIIDNLKNNDRINIFPNRFEKILLKWMNEIKDWCISRQLWWGHRIPAWYKDKEIKVQINSPGKDWIQDEDVLDTWFSSGIAPFSFLDWPNKNENIKRFYPISLLVTGYDIIFFWVARMYFQSLYIMKEKPFKDILIHGLIRDANGKKMSKSLNNGIDPMKVIEKYGSDSLRWFLLTNSSPGQDIRYSIEKIESAWNLNNKIWNISRYIIEIMEDGNEVNDVDKWILNKLNKLEKVISEKMDSYDFTIIGKEFSKFINEDFSSWYIEFTKINQNKQTSLKILKKILIIIHPFMPFISDHIFELIDRKELLENNWPSIKKMKKVNYIDEVIEIIKKIRNFREEKNISKSIIINYYCEKMISKEAKKMIKKMSNSEFKFNQDAKIPLNNNIIYIELTNDMKKQEKERISKEIKFLKFEIKRSSSMLLNTNFMSKAPKEKILEEENKLKKFKKNLQEIKGK